MKKKLKKQKISKIRILEVAKNLFIEHGYKATSIRKIASNLDISPTTIYLYYEDKAEIMHALHSEGFKLLNKQFETLHHVEDPFERLKAMGRCYLNFATENDGYYEIMFIMKEPLEHLKVQNKTLSYCEWEEGETAFHALISVVEDCIKKGYFKGYDAKTLALLLWANLHGLCALNNNGHLGLITDKENINSSDILQYSFESYCKMLKNA